MESQRIRVSEKSVLEPVESLEKGVISVREKRVLALDYSVPLIFRFRGKLEGGEDEIERLERGDTSLFLDSDLTGASPLTLVEAAVCDLYRKKKPSGKNNGCSVHMPNGYTVVNFEKHLVMRAMLPNDDWLRDSWLYVGHIRFWKFKPEV